MASPEERRAAIENARKLVESGVIASQAYTSGQPIHSPLPAVDPGPPCTVETPAKPR